jgi:hypothetical protein
MSTRKKIFWIAVIIASGYSLMWIQILAIDNYFAGFENQEEIDSIRRTVGMIPSFVWIGTIIFAILVSILFFLIPKIKKRNN